MKKQHKHLLLTKENIRVLSGHRLVQVAGGTIDVTGVDTGGGDTTVVGPDGGDDSNHPLCAYEGSASKAPTGVC